MFNFESNEIVMIPIDRIDLPETALRLFEPRSREEIERLAESVRENGLLQPILVVRKGETGRFEILGGETRFRASNLAGNTEVPCRIVQLTGDPGELFLIALMDNLARKNLHPLDIADALNRHLDYVERHEQIYRAIGWTKSRFSQVLGLSNLPEEVRQILRNHRDNDDGDWNATERHLRAINQLTGIDQVLEKQIEITTRMLDRRWNVARTEAEVKQVIDQSVKGKSKRNPRQFVIPGLPRGCSAKVAPGKLVVEIRLEKTDSWPETWEGIAAILGNKNFDPTSFLQPNDDSKPIPKPTRKNIACRPQSENFPPRKALLLLEGSQPFLSKKDKPKGGSTHEERNQRGNQTDDAIERRGDSQA